MKWITITPDGQSKSGKTRQWVVLTKAEPAYIIGYVKWWPAWRKYAFYPALGSLFEWDCLRDIADFIAQATVEHYENAKVARSAKP